MLSYLRGIVLRKTLKYLIVENAGIGYRVFVKESDLEQCKTGQTVELFVHQYVREDTLNLYGFHSFEELEMFEMLLSISGIGPKAGLAILHLASVEQIRTSIISGDSSLLTRVSGVGKKTAERVILELKNKIGTLSSASYDSTMDAAELSRDVDTLDALEALGYSKIVSREVLTKLRVGLTTEERIKEALKLLGKV